MHVLIFSLALLLHAPTVPQAQQSDAPHASASSEPAGLLPPDQLTKLLPPSVFFREQTAPLQLRNASAFRFHDGAILFASLVDTSGYSTAVRERYQLYLLSEVPLTIAGKSLAAGAYGAGFLEDGTFVVMDVGGHDLLLSRTERDDAMHRPRPLQMIVGPKPEELRLYLGRSFVRLTRETR